MGDLGVRRVEPVHTKIKNVPIAVTPEGFWCCPYPVVFQKTLKNQANPNKHKPSPSPSPAPAPAPESAAAAGHKQAVQRSQQPPAEKKQSPPDQTDSAPVAEDQRCLKPEAPPRAPNPISESPQQKISVGFGHPDTSDLMVVLSGKEGVAVRMSVHKNVLSEHSALFAGKLSRSRIPIDCIDIADCEDVEIYVETIGLMYCNEVKQRLIKQSVPRVLRVLKVAESLGFRSCVRCCLEYLEAVPWVGEEEDSVVSSVRRLQTGGAAATRDFAMSPILKRVVSSEPSKPPNDTLAHIIDLVLKSNEERGRREMKALVLKLLRENSLLINGAADICAETLYSSCRRCLASLLLLAGHGDGAPPDGKDTMPRRVALEADNLLWITEIMADRHIADELAVMWAGQDELAALHAKLPLASRHPMSCITARLFVGIGKGEMLPAKETRQRLLQVWLQPLIEDYGWLQHGCRSFNRKAVEEGIGRTILTLPLEDQQSFLLSWLGSFLKVGDRCPNLQRAFEVWWRRTFIRPHLEQRERSGPL